MRKTTNLQADFSAIIKRKAVGPSGSRHLNEDDLHVIVSALKSDEITLTPKAVLITAVILLDRNDVEKKLLEDWKSGDQFLPVELKAFFFEKPQTRFHQLLAKVLNGKDLDEGGAKSAMRFMWNDHIPAYQKGVMLIGERLKRETMSENQAFLQQMRQEANAYETNVPLLIDLADPYDGFKRYPIYTPFVASLLAAMGFRAYCHGTKIVAPKNGDTIHKMLDLAGKNPLKNEQETISDIEDEAAGWGYIDLSIYFPALHNLTLLREQIVKRPFLATLDKLLQPIRSAQRNLVTAGYVHSAYKGKLAKLLQDKPAIDRALIVKGMEGSTQVDFRKEAQNVAVCDGQHFSVSLSSLEIDYPENEWSNCNSLAEYALETGVAALKGKQNTARDILINQTMHIISGFDLLEADDARARAQNLLDSGKALEHWQNGVH